MRSKPEKLWLIIGHRPSVRVREVSYSTDPRDYELPDQNPLTDEEYAQISSRVRVFLAPADAINFCYDCGLESTQCIRKLPLSVDCFEVDLFGILGPGGIYETVTV